MSDGQTAIRPVVPWRICPRGQDQMGVANTTWEQETPDVNVGAERAKPYGLECSPEGDFALSERGFSPVAVFQRKTPPPVCPEDGIGIQCLCQLMSTRTWHQGLLRRNLAILSAI